MLEATSAAAAAAERLMSKSDQQYLSKILGRFVVRGSFHLVVGGLGPVVESAAAWGIVSNAFLDRPMRALTHPTAQTQNPTATGLTQEAVDAMQPAMSTLPGWEARNSRGGSAGGCAAAASQLQSNEQGPLSPVVASGASVAADAQPGYPAATSVISVDAIRRSLSEQEEAAAPADE